MIIIERLGQEIDRWFHPIAGAKRAPPAAPLDLAPGLVQFLPRTGRRGCKAGPKRLISMVRMGGRVVEGTGLENRRGGDVSVGSNPTPSATTALEQRTSASTAKVVSPTTFKVLRAEGARGFESHPIRQAPEQRTGASLEPVGLAKTLDEEWHVRRLHIDRPVQRRAEARL